MEYHSRKQTNCSDVLFETSCIESVSNTIKQYESSFPAAFPFFRVQKAGRQILNINLCYLKLIEIYDDIDIQETVC